MHTVKFSTLLRIFIICTLICLLGVANLYAYQDDIVATTGESFKAFLDGFIVKEYKKKEPKKIKANAIFSGGGIGSLVLAGAIYAADEGGIKFKRVGGSSGGAVLASLYAAGYTPKEIAQIISDTDFKDFIQGDIKFSYFLTHMTALAKNYSFFKSDAIYEWIRDLLEKKGIKTFRDLDMPLKIIATDIFHHRRVVFDKESYPDMEVAHAIRMSIAIPLFFSPIEWDDPLLPKNKSKCLMLDGNVLSPYPSDIFSSYKERDVPTFGFVLVDEERDDVDKVDDLVDFVRQIINTVNIYNEQQALKKSAYIYNITLSAGEIRSIQFDLNEEEKKKLFDSGYRTMEEYLENWWRRR